MLKAGMGAGPWDGPLREQPSRLLAGAWRAYLLWRLSLGPADYVWSARGAAADGVNPMGTRQFVGRPPVVRCDECRCWPGVNVQLAYAPRNVGMLCDVMLYRQSMCLSWLPTVSCHAP